MYANQHQQQQQLRQRAVASCSPSASSEPEPELEQDTDSAEGSPVEPARLQLLAQQAPKLKHELDHDNQLGPDSEPEREVGAGTNGDDEEEDDNDNDDEDNDDDDDDDEREPEDDEAEPQPRGPIAHRDTRFGPTLLLGSVLAPQHQQHQHQLHHQQHQPQHQQHQQHQHQHEHHQPLLLLPQIQARPAQPAQPARAQQGAATPASAATTAPATATATVEDEAVKQMDLFGLKIVALTINGKERLCLAQISNTLLKEFSYNEIHNRRVALGITCVQCTPIQLEMLRRAGAMPSSSRRCGMITRREAERLCRSFLVDEQPPELPENFYFTVGHRINYGCKGRFVPARYISSRAKCIECFYCGDYFSPNKFIFHSHRQPHSSDCNPPDSPNINSWRKHIDLDPAHHHGQDVRYAWEDVKSLFNGGTRRRGPPNPNGAVASTNNPESGSNNNNNPASQQQPQASQPTKLRHQHTEADPPVRRAPATNQSDSSRSMLAQDDGTSHLARPWINSSTPRQANSGKLAGELSAPAGATQQFKRQHSQPSAQSNAGQPPPKRHLNQGLQQSNGSSPIPGQQGPNMRPCQRPQPTASAAQVPAIFLSADARAEKPPMALSYGIPPLPPPSNQLQMSPAPPSQHQTPTQQQLQNQHLHHLQHQHQQHQHQHQQQQHLHQHLQQHPHQTLGPELLYSQLYSQLMQPQASNQHLQHQHQQQHQQQLLDAQIAIRHQLWSSLLANLQCGGQAAHAYSSLVGQLCTPPGDPTGSAELEHSTRLLNVHSARGPAKPARTMVGNGVDLTGSANYKSMSAIRLPTLTGVPGHHKQFETTAPQSDPHNPIGR